MSKSAVRRRASPRARRPVPTSLGLVRLCLGTLYLAMLFTAVPPLRGIALWLRDRAVVAVNAARLTDIRQRKVMAFARRYGIGYDLASEIEHAASAEGIDPELAFRLVEVESGFREDVVSPVGARGLTQLMPTTAAWLQPGITDAQTFERTTNLRLGFRYLRHLLRRYDGNVTEALHAYNRGPGTVARIRAAGGDPANGYARRVLYGDSILPYAGSGLLPGPGLTPHPTEQDGPTAAPRRAGPGRPATR